MVVQLCEFTKCHLEMVERMNFMFCVFYHNKKERGYFILSSLQRIPLSSLTVPPFFFFFNVYLPFFSSFFLAVVSGLRWVTPDLNPDSRTQLRRSFPEE